MNVCGAFDGYSREGTFAKQFRTMLALLCALSLGAVSGCGGGGSSTPQNVPPVANAGADFQADERLTVTLNGSASRDSDGSITSYSWRQTSGRTVTIAGAGQAVATFTAPEVTPAGENLVFELTVTDDDGATNADSVTVSIVNVNLAPVADSGPDQTVYEGQSVTLNAGNSDDQDGIITSYSWEQLSGVATDIPDPNQPQVTFTAPATSVRLENTYQLTVTDELGATGIDQVSVTIRPIVPPSANAGPDQVVESGSIVVLSGAASTDSDGTIVAYLWTQLSGPPVNLDNETIVGPSFAAPQVAELTLIQFELVVTDDAAATSSDVVDITVTPPQHDVSGTIIIPPGNLVDSDVNDQLAPYEANDAPEIAQYLPGVVTVGGYANRPLQGAEGRSYWGGDVSDYYRLQLASGQQTILHVGDAASGDLDLYLWDSSGTQIIDASAGTSATEVVLAPADGEYLLEVYTWSGASTYVMNVEPLASPGSQASSASLHHDFVPYQAIVRHQAQGADGLVRTFDAETVSALGLRAPERASALASLYTVSPTLDRVATHSGRPPDELRKRSQAFSDPTMRSKWETLLAIKMIGNDSAVQYAEPNFLRKSIFVPDDEYFDRQWHYTFINVPTAWDVTLGDPSVVVAVIDSGVLVNHPDLMGNMRNGYDFISLTEISNDGDGIDPDPDDPGDSCGAGDSSFHGTHVQGTIGAATNNQVGVAGIAPGATMMPLRALGCGGGTTYDIAQAVLYAAGLANDSGIIVDDPADVINLSLGGSGYSQYSQDVYLAARATGAIIVAAAGNSATNAPQYPAAYEGVISVSAVGSDGLRSDYSNFGPTTDVTAPGGTTFADVNNDGFPDLVFSTDGQDDIGMPVEHTYEYKAGTSMAAPHVAGVLALMKSVNGSLTPADIDAMLIRGEIVVDIGEAGWDQFYGWGLIDARMAVDAAIAAIGSPPGDTPAMIVSPADLQLGAFTSGTTFEVSNAAGGTLVVEGIGVAPDAPWLSISPQSVDANGAGIYQVSVSRDGLEEGIYSTNVTITSNANSRSLTITMLVPPELVFTPSAGSLWVLLMDADSRITRFATRAELNAGQLTYSFTGVYEGTYELIAGSDSDGDFFICDSGESCGAYTSYAAPTPVLIDADTAGLDFVVDYEWFLPTATSRSGDALAPNGRSIVQGD